MDEKKENWLPWIIAAGAVFLMLRNQQPGQDTSKPAVAEVVDLVCVIHTSLRAHSLISFSVRIRLRQRSR